MSLPDVDALRSVRCAAVQLDAVLGDVEANLAACEVAVTEAASQGAQLVVLPEFFTSGVAYRLEVADAAQPIDGWVLQAVTSWASRHDILISGSMLVRDVDGHVRNAQVLVGPQGLLGRHDKDLPTMWENALYTTGDDDGRLQIPAAAVASLPDALEVGAALCWELTRRNTVRRLAGRVDLVVAGSGWWSIPRWSPAAVFEHWERANRQRAQQTPGVFARLVGAPVVHAAHVGELSCPMPGQPGHYRGHYEGGTGIWDSDGQPLASLPAVGSGAGTATQVTADVPLQRRTPPPAPSSYWLTPPGTMPRYAWHWQRVWGRRFYRRHVYAPAS